MWVDSPLCHNSLRPSFHGVVKDSLIQVTSLLHYCLFILHYMLVILWRTPKENVFIIHVVSHTSWESTLFFSVFSHQSASLFFP